MDVRIAVITGTVFAGVLLAGALAAPRGDGGTNSGTDPAGDSAGVVAADTNGSLISETTLRRSDDDDHEDDGHEREHGDDQEDDD